MLPGDCEPDSNVGDKGRLFGDDVLSLPLAPGAKNMVIGDEISEGAN
jgi:hypothetical protein